MGECLDIGVEIWLLEPVPLAEGSDGADRKKRQGGERRE